jgi:hypothetical protein
LRNLKKICTEFAIAAPAPANEPALGSVAIVINSAVFLKMGLCTKILLETQVLISRYVLQFDYCLLKLNCFLLWRAAMRTFRLIILFKNAFLHNITFLLLFFANFYNIFTKQIFSKNNLPNPQHIFDSTLLLLYCQPYTQ